MDDEADVLGQGRWGQERYGGRDDGPAVPPGSGLPSSRVGAHGSGARWDELLDGVLDDGRWGAPGGPWLTQVSLVGDRVVDVTRRPALGSEYECAALELEYRARPPEPPPAPRPPGHELQLAWLATLVGGDEALARLTDDPLPDEDLRLDGVSPWLRPRMAAVDGLVARHAPVLLGPEGTTAVRRLLARLLRESPAVVTRVDRPEVAAAALVWTVAKANDLAGQARGLPAKEVQRAFTLSSTSFTTRATAFAHAVGGGPRGFSRTGYHGPQEPDVPSVGDAALLVGPFRRRLVGCRDLARSLRACTPPA